MYDSELTFFPWGFCGGHTPTFSSLSLLGFFRLYEHLVVLRWCPRVQAMGRAEDDLKREWGEMTIPHSHQNRTSTTGRDVGCVVVSVWLCRSINVDVESCVWSMHTGKLVFWATLKFLRASGSGHSWPPPGYTWSQMNDPPLISYASTCYKLKQEKHLLDSLVFNTEELPLSHPQTSGCCCHSCALFWHQWWGRRWPLHTDHPGCWRSSGSDQQWQRTQRWSCVVIEDSTADLYWRQWCMYSLQHNIVEGMQTGPAACGKPKDGMYLPTMFHVSLQSSAFLTILML